MTTTAPVSHIEEALKLEADAPIDLFTVTLRGGTIIRFRNGASVTWQGHLYEGLACEMSGEGLSADDEKNRPALTVLNPDKIFGSFAAEGLLDMAIVVRRRVMQQHLLADTGLSQQRIWLLGRITLVTSQVIRVELRSPIDMPAWKTPNSFYMPPEYPFVVL